MNGAISPSETFGDVLKMDNFSNTTPQHESIDFRNVKTDFKNFEHLELYTKIAGSTNTVKLDARSIFEMTDGQNVLTIAETGFGDSDVKLYGSFDMHADTEDVITIDGDTYIKYTGSHNSPDDVTLFVESTIDVTVTA